MPSWSDLLNWLSDVFISFINMLSHALYLFVSWIISLFPSLAPLPPFPGLPDTSILNAIAWVFPVGSILASVTFWVSSALIYFSVKAFLRWL